ncbi:hypothetical protein Ate02nite_95900 [Paractinoplanes tereljensis]|uniref:Uncharacterized protein n=1 Tax=Paractinoplanes tereljensis TaxID=571912 RepID=A0A919NX47_9ACTN|nr:hypothetical protein Ate02nite_95900 [Actinoplanes tereljensis]
MNAVGTGLLPVHDPIKPTEVLPMDPFQAALVTVTCAPDWANVPPHPCVTFCVVVGKSKPSDHDETASPRFVMAISP